MKRHHAIGLTFINSLKYVLFFILFQNYDEFRNKVIEIVTASGHQSVILWQRRYT